MRRCLIDFFRYAFLITHFYPKLYQCCINSNIGKAITISINVNIDGLPVFKSSRTQFWPILFHIVEMPTPKPMPIAIFCGQSKPTNLEEFLRPFVDELQDIMTNGVLVNGNIINIRLNCIICDSPARAFIKGKTIKLQHL